MEKAKKFAVSYKPDPVSTYVLGTFTSEVGALEAAIGYARMYYGECSAIAVRYGKRILHVIPRNAGRL